MRRAVACATLAVLLAAMLSTASADERPARLLVLDRDGTPLTGARLVAARGMLGGRAIFDPAAPVLARTDVAGRIDALAGSVPPAGSLIVWFPGRAPALVPDGPGPATVRLMRARGTQGRLRVVLGRKAEGRELVAVPASPHADLVHRAVTAKSGAYAFALLHRGEWDLFLRRSGNRLQRIGRVQAGEDAGEARLVEATSLRGRVLDGDGTHRAPVAGATLRFVPLPGGGAGPRAHVTVTTGDDGTWLADGMHSGVYRVEMLDRDWVFEPGQPRVQAEAARAREVETWFAIRRQVVRGRVLDADEKPVPGVAVRLLPDPTRALPPGARARGSDVVRSDPQGRYAIREVAPGEGWRLVASAAGYSPWTSNPFRVDRGRATELKPFHLRPGWSVAVRVRDERGEPVVRAAVVATSARRPTSAEDPLWAETVRRGATDASGRLLLQDLPDDDVLLRVRANGFLESVAHVPLPRVSDRRNADISLHAAVSLTGTLLVPEGGPAGPYRVLARRRDAADEVSAEVDAGGGFRFDDLAETSFDLRVERGTRADARILAVLENVVPGPEEHVEITLPVLRAIRGSVEDLALDGPEPTVVVEAQRFDAERERYAWRVAARARVERRWNAGTFEVLGLAPGMYAVRVVQGAVDTGTVSVLVDEEDVEGLELAMPAGGRIAGSVLDATGRPRLGARVTCTRLHGDDEARLLPGGPLTRHTDERGDFVFERLAPGLWRVEAADEETASDVETVRLQDGEVLVVRDLVLGGGGTLEGLVEDAQGRPLDGIVVSARRFDRDGADVVLRTDGEGRFRLRDARPGAWLVRVVAATVAGGPWVEAVAEVEAGTTALVRFTPGEDGAIEGTLLRRGKAVAGAVIDLVHEPQQASGALRRFRTTTAVDGTFTVAGLDAGRYTVQVQSGAWRTSHGVDLVPGDRLALDLEAFEGRLRGSIVTRDGDPVPGAFVEAVPLDEDGRLLTDAGFRAEGRANPRGVFVLRGVPVGRYTLAVSAPGLPPGRFEGAEADLPGADFAVEVVLGRGGDIDLRVRDREDRGVTGALVWVEDAAGVALHRHAYVTGAAGRLRIEGVPAGSVRLRLHARGLGRPALRTVRVEEGRTADVSMQLLPAGTIRLIVTGEGSDPLARTRVDVLRAGTGEMLASRRPLSPIRLAPPWGWVPRTGVVTIGDLEAGIYTARISAGRTYEQAEVPIEVAPGAVTEVRVTLAPAER